MTEPKNLKAKPKAYPSRILTDIQNARLIRDRQVIDNDFIHLADSDGLSAVSLPAGNISVPLRFWLENKTTLKQRQSAVAVQIAADEVVADLADDLQQLTIIVLPFVVYTDGRSYSHAYLLRTRYHFSGEIRAVGDVHFDQLDFLARVGINAFELPDSDDCQAALAAFNAFSEVYQPSADNEQLIFSRRRANSKPYITFVKKILADGNPCKKCQQVSDRLKEEGLINLVNHIAIADERDADSEGMRLAKQHQVERAPFFLVENSKGEVEIYDVYFKFKKYAATLC